jgi:hypothetical protein
MDAVELTSMQAIVQDKALIGQMTDGITQQGIP